MIDERHLMTIFSGALDCEAGAKRAAYLDEVCGSNPELRTRIDALLRAHEHAAQFLEPHSASTLDVATNPQAGTQLAGCYKLLELIGEGGMGTVWMAQQTEPVKRLVALKLIKAGMDSKQVIARFEAERQALALMDHPNIAKVLDGGATPSGRPYFVMDLVKGVPITKYCDEHHLTPRQRLELLIPVCQAVQHAHQKGIIHRDLKPSNVLVALYDGRPVPKVIDFGVAKAAGQQLTEKTLVTGFGDIVGTLEYMSPEQAELNQLDIDTRSDIYSLGVLLYELLAGSPPFTRKELGKAGMLEMLRVIREQEPSKPSTKLSTAEGLPTLAANRGTEPAKLTKLVHGELDWIVMKALEKDRNRRYETANGFAMDVQRYLADEPVQACPPSAWYKLRKFARRNKPMVMLLAVSGVAALALLGIAISLFYNVQLKAARDAEQVQRERTQAASRDLETNLYFRRMLLAEREWSANNVSRAEELLDESPIHLRDWEWHYLKRQCHMELLTFRGHYDAVDDVAFSPDGPLLASAGEDGAVTLWNADTGQEIRTLRGHTMTLWRSIAFSPDGKLLAAASGEDWLLNGRGEIRVWDVSSGREVLTLVQPDLAWCVTFSPDGRFLVAGTGQTNTPGEVIVWEARTGELVLTLRGHTREVCSVAFSADGNYLASASGSMVGLEARVKRNPGEIKIWDMRTGEELVSLRGHSRDIASVAFIPDGRQIASASWDGTVKIWDVKTSQELATLRGHAGGVTCVRFSPDSRHLASASYDRTVRIWDAKTGQEVRTLRGHTEWVNKVAFSPDGKRLASASDDKSIKIWDATARQEILDLRREGVRVWSVAFSRDGQRLAAGTGHLNTGGELKILDTQCSQVTLTLKRLDGAFGSVMFYPDGRRLLSIARQLGVKTADRVQVWDTVTGQELPSPCDHAALVREIVFSPDGSRFASALVDGTAKLCDVATGRVIHTLEGHTKPVRSVAFNPHGEILASAGNDTSVKIWDVATGEELRTLRGHTRPVLSVVFSPNGELLASASDDSSVRIWDMTTGQERFTLRGHGAPVVSVVFRPDGRRMASASEDATVKVWDVATGQETLTLRGHTDVVVSLAFSPDGQRLASAGDDGTVKIWDATPLDAM